MLGALASCFTTTFRSIAEHSTFEYTDLQMEVEGVVSRSGPGYNFAEVIVRANLTVPSEADQERGLKLLHKTKELCLVSRALAIPQTFESAVTVAAPVSIG